MKGDFSRWEFESEDNFSGVLHQQGRVLLDSDWNAQTRITIDWQDQAGQDIIGPGVAAVPASHPDSFKVQRAIRTNDGNVELMITPGRLWADGILVRLSSDSPVSPIVPQPGRPDVSYADRDVVREGRFTPTAPSLDNRGATVGRIRDIPSRDNLVSRIVPLPGGIDNNVRDAVVILEVWREAINGFQMPDKLIEPALGGPDTTERVHTAMRFQLHRLSAGETCDTIRDSLKDDFSKKGKLKVSLQPTTEKNGDCPVVEGGGYTGFEHHLYRIEIAHVNDTSGPMFKWSQFNGGLVGRGDCSLGGADKKITIKANDQAIKLSGLFDQRDAVPYLEVVELAPNQDYWRVTYGAEVTLNGDDLEIKTERYYVGGTRPSGRVFFRLWNGIEEISQSPFRANPKELRDGIRLEFEPPAGDYYVPGDYWTFKVRAGEVGNEEILIGDDKSGELPEGIHYHCVPLAILNWNAKGDISVDKDQIDDCRKIFPPLTDLNPGCCIAVAPEDDLLEVVREVIKAGGGCICLLPGDHRLTKQINLTGVSNIRFEGFGLASRLHISERLGNLPPFLLKNTTDISFNAFAVFHRGKTPVWSCQNVRDLAVKQMFVYSPFSAGSQPIFQIQDSQSNGWRLENNIFLGNVGLGGLALSRSVIRSNLWVGLLNGIDLSNLMDVRVERNQWLGITGENIEAFAPQMEQVINRMVAAKKTTTDTQWLREILPLVDSLVNAARTNVVSRYVGLDVSGAFELEFIENIVVGHTGLNAEIVENGKIHGNTFLTTIFGANCGLVHGLRFTENRVGQQQPPRQTDMGLRILADAIDCKILDNLFLSVKEGIVFESDLNGRKEIIRDFAGNLLRREAIRNEEMAPLLKDAEKRVEVRLSKQVLRKSTFFRIGKCERTLIQGNLLRADAVGIEWSGTKNIIDFRISNNAFIGCQEVAIQIEPDEQMLFVAEPVDTKVRLIEKNRFEIFAGTVRATIGAVRVEKNDIRVLPPPVRLVEPPLIRAPWKDVTCAIAESVYRDPPFLNAVKNDDVPLMRMMAVENVRRIEINPDPIDTETFSKTLDTQILSTYKPRTGNMLADTAFVMKTLADINAKVHLVDIVNTKIPKANFNLEGFVINLTGIQNRVIHNHIFSNNAAVSGGIVFHLLSGEVRDNEVAVSQTGLLMNGKAGQSSQGARISGNSLKVFGLTAGEGKTSSVYALIIPELPPGHLSIIDNYFEGSVMIGADPISSFGVYKKETIEWIKNPFTYHNLAFDLASLNEVIATKFMPDKSLIPLTLNPKIANIVLKVPLFLMNPHQNRPIIQFTDNRVVRGWTAISQSTAGVYWGEEALKKEPGKSLILHLSNNIFDYSAKVVGYDLIIVGNHSQVPIEYGAGNKIEQIANIPEPKRIF